MNCTLAKVKHPFGIRWSIPKYRLSRAIKTGDGGLSSSTYQINGVKYYIKLFVNGDAERYVGPTWIGLYLDNAKEIEAEFTISIKSANVSKTLTYVYRKYEGFGFKLCNTSELFDAQNGYIVDDEISIRLVGSLMMEENRIVLPQELGDDLLNMCLWNQEYKDFTIVAEGKEIMAHKCVLAARSPVFEAMFKPHTKEAQESQVIIPDFPSRIVEFAIKICYHSSLVGYVFFEDQLLLLQFYDKYDIKSLKDKLQHHLITVMNQTNVCHLANASILSNAFKLQNKCIEFLHECLNAKKAVSDLNIIDVEFKLEVFETAFDKNSL